MSWIHKLADYLEDKKLEKSHGGYNNQEAADHKVNRIWLFIGAGVVIAIIISLI